MAQGYPQPRRGRDFRAVPGRPQVYNRPHRRYRQSLFERRTEKRQAASSRPKSNAAKLRRAFLKRRGFYAAAATIGAAAAYYGVSRRTPESDEGTIYPATPAAPIAGMSFARSLNPTAEFLNETLTRNDYYESGGTGGYRVQFDGDVQTLMAAADPYYKATGAETDTPLSSWPAALSWKGFQSDEIPAKWIAPGEYLFVKTSSYPEYNNERLTDVYIDPSPTVVPNVASRQRINANTQPANVPWSALRQWKQYLREVSPDPNPIPRPRPVPNTGITITVPPSGKPTVSRGPNHTFSPPRAGQKEKKGKSKFDAVWDIFGEAMNIGPGKLKRNFDRLTEALDWLNAVYYALPEDVILESRAFTPQEKALAIAKNWDEINVDTLLKNIIVMEVGDRVLAKMSKDAKLTFDITTLFGAAL